MAAPRAALPFALLAALLLAGCSGNDGARDDRDGDGADDGGDGGDDGPDSALGFELQVGDFWVHTTSGGGADGTLRTEVVAIEQHRGFRAYRVAGEATTGASGNTSAAESTTWSRASDMATIEIQTSSHVSYMGYESDTETSTVFDPPCEGMQWPLSVGQEWEATCSATTAFNGQNSTSSTTSRSKVEAQEPVTVPAGTFDTFRVVVTSGGTSSTMWVSAHACGMVKSVSTAQGQTATTELTEVDC